MEIYSLDGTRMASYLYDAWGRVLQVNESSSLNLGALNPYRYRGYYYDTETGLYYLETRYYDPARGRFLNPDGIEYLEPEVIGGLNLYAYCNNNPVMYSDPDGHSIVAAIIVGVIVGAAVGGTIGGTVAYRSAKSSGLEGEDLFWATMMGVGKGALIGGALGGLAGATGGVSLFTGSGLLTPAVVGGSVAVSNGAVAVATGLGVLGISYIMFSKHEPKMTNKPPRSWTTNNEGMDAMKRHGMNANKAADDIMNSHFDNWHRGAGTDHNAIKKWLDRVIRKLM